MTRQTSRGKKTKVLLVLYYYTPYVSGLTVYAMSIAEALVEHGYDVTVITSRYDMSLPKREVINGVKIIRKTVVFGIGKGVIMPTFWPSIVLHAAQSDYVNMHLPMAESGLASLFIPKRKIVTTYHCDIYLGESVVNRLVMVLSLNLMRLQLARSRVIIANTRDYFEHSQMRHFIYKLKPVYPPVSLPGRVTGVQNLFRRLGVSEQEIKIGFVGRIVYEKGIEYLLQAVPYLRKGLPNFKIIVLGDYEKVAGGSVKDQLDEYLRRYPDNIQFTGYLDNLDRNRFYAGLDVLVLPSIDPLESFGMVQVEAMFAGVPVVASDMPGVREVIKKTGYGRISKPRNPRDIARQVTEVVEHPTKYRPTQSKVIKMFNAKDSVDAYKNFMPQR